MILCLPGQYEHFRKTKDDLKAIRNSGLREFYERQNEILDGFAEVEEILSSTLPDTIIKTLSHRTSVSGTPTAPYAILASPRVRSDMNGSGIESMEQGDRPDEEDPLLPQSQTREEARLRADKIALNVNILVNIILLSLKGVAVMLSSSISLLASFVDAALDFLSTLIIWGAAFAAARGDSGIMSKYPAGRKRFEPLGVLIFSVCMIASFSQVFVESVRKLVKNESGDAGTLSLFGKATMIATIAVKLVIWMWCSKFRSSGILALAQDAKNDVFFNVFSLLLPWLGEIFSIRQLDPIGGALLSIYIIMEWIRTLHENFVKLSGHIASSDHHFRILYLISSFHPVKEISYLEVYHVGDELIVEVDVILPQETSLHYAHDVGETIQATLEALDMVSRAYVHLDYSSTNPAQHGSRPRT